MQNALAVLVFVLGCWGLYRLPAVVRLRAGTGIGGRYLTAWAGALSFTLGLGAFFVLWGDGLHRGRASWVQFAWPSTIALAVAWATLYAIGQTLWSGRRARA